MQKINSKFIPIALIIILGFMVYGNSLNGEFIWDDGNLIKNNTYIKSWSNILNVFTKNIEAGIGERYYFYRPFQMVTYMMDYSLWRLDLRGYHLTNILLHILAALAVYWLINVLFGDNLLSLFTSLLFLVHPIHTEAVAYISGRSDSLVLLFMLPSFIFYIKYLRQKSVTVYILMILSYVLAVLSRENSLILPLLLLLYHYSFKKELKIRQLLPILTIAFIYILLRLTLLKSLLAFYPTTLFQGIPGFFVAIAKYLGLLFSPSNLHMEYGNKLFHLADPRAILGILILFSLLIFAFRKRSSDTLIFFSISWFFVTLLPVSNLYPINAYMAEHWLYLPSIGFFLVLARLLSYLYRTKSLRLFALFSIVSLVISFSCLTIRQNIYWREPIAFYERTLKYAPDSPRMYNNLANTYYRIGDYEEAIPLYKQAIEINPVYLEAYHNLANTYYRIGDYEQAITLYKKIIKINPTYAMAYNRLANAYYRIGDYKQAISLYKKAIEINPVYAEAHNNLATVYHQRGNYEQAIALYRQAIEINSTYAMAYNNLAGCYFRKKQYKLAVKYCDKARELGFADPALLEALKPYR